MTPAEFEKLVQSALSSNKSIQCYSGEVRARIYILSYMTGLRRSELASLTPGSFDLESEQPTLTVEAGASKHRRQDILPLHEDLVPQVREWIAELEPEQPLFPKLAKRRTWLMVKKDLERVGIPYETKDGIADFHAAGRHSHITGLLKSGVSVPHAMALARHSDVRMTMRYTHLGIDEQAEALKSLPGSWRDIGRKSGVPELPAKSSPVSKCHKEDAGSDVVSTDDTSPCDADRHKKPQPDTDGEKWRRRESNEQYALRNYIVDTQLTNSPNRLSGNCQEISGTEWLDLSSVDTALSNVIEAWDRLPKHVRDAICTMCNTQLSG